MKTKPMQRIQCPLCDKHPYVRGGRVETHTYVRVTYGSGDGVHWHETGRQDVVCDWSGTFVRQHTKASFHVTLTDKHGRPLQWAGSCDCGDKWLHGDVDTVITKWSSHVQHATATA
jgi:hypothetical protein